MSDPVAASINILEVRRRTPWGRAVTWDGTAESAALIVEYLTERGLGAAYDSGDSICVYGGDQDNRTSVLHAGSAVVVMPVRKFCIVSVAQLESRYEYALLSHRSSR